ncbi:chromodomain-helicase-DNA-binding protein 1-like isoform X1 [Anguilla anguilla]|uniref:chromodomain-helicase-DNA-binding protein 1-like isoform X1 n=1 Tax=Anguilla anguilla TaxID=7936 RepID=UPI0015A7B702|nr:chromodomain-helicase-DNA-binding protein 1-like isoform X1 [Anguilla anguilla]XP_035250473.1 chromodomain-helicase-DNA-binding protein 1-like isoform X1 [Anguilla anguilla]
MSSFPWNTTPSTSDKDSIELTEKDLIKWGLKGIQLRPYQLDGVKWLVQCLENQEGCILGDEMGLGKTCQTISLLVYARGALGYEGPFLILSPLSVMNNWREEMERFAPGLSVVCYQGDKEKRAELQRDLSSGRRFHVLLTTYELCLNGASFLKRWKWKVLVVDEAHRLKNQNSLLRRALTEFSVRFRVLLTGTPVQNSLQEVYSLLSFIQPPVFPEDQAEDFVSAYANVQTEPALATELHGVLQPYLLRRVKAEVALELPRKTELLVYHGLSALQKRYYKAILTKDLDAFENEQGSRTRLLNILVQLRKCVNHPYLFDGVEPEPFEMGEHLVEASGKLRLLDSMLEFLHKGGHRVLLFSQMTRVLDILQDYMEYRGYSYERLDGSVRGEERNLAIKNFSSKDVFVFLLSTKAGGVGMNLTAADTVIFMDSDFNPQNDLQAAARAHRIGQTRAVKVIRLLGRDTVEEIVYRRAASKLRLTNTVIEEGRFSLLEQAQSAAAGLQLSEILKFGVDKLLASEESSVQDVDLGLILGRSRGGHWLDEDDPAVPGEEEEDADTDNQTHMYLFEGRDYSKDPSSEDESRFRELLEEQLARLGGGGSEGRTLRRKTGVSLCGPLAAPGRRKRPLSEEELELRRQRRREAAAKRAKLQEERRRAKEEAQHRKKMAWWDSCGYQSLCLTSEGSEEEEEEEEGDDLSVSSTDSEHTAIRYVLGDVTHPQAAQEDAIIVHCVDDSGRWGRGGLFTALEVRTDEARRQYELAGKMDDLELGHVLLFPIDDKQSRFDGRDYLALIVAQQRDQSNRLSGIKMSALEEGLKKIHRAAKKKEASVHLPRIGHATKGFNWYGTERLVRKHLSSRGIPTSIYYYSSRAASSRPSAVAASASPTSRGGAVSQAAGSSAGAGAGTSGGGAARSADSGGPVLASFMSGVHIFFYNLAASERKRLARYLITYDGDEEELMSADVTHIVAEVESPVHTQELKDLLHGCPQALPVQKAWLEACFSKQRKVNTANYLIGLH